jgi:single-strand DNA-binding protein
MRNMYEEIASDAMKKQMRGGEATMRSVNKVILLGNLTRGPELKQTEGKKPVCIFGLATNRTWMSYTGEKRDEPMFHRIIAWDQWAETCQKYLKKGRKVYVEGRLQSHSYTGQDGVERTGVEVVLEDLVFVDSMPKDVQETKDSSESATVQQV